MVVVLCLVDRLSWGTRTGIATVEIVTLSVASLTTNPVTYTLPAGTVPAQSTYKTIVVSSLKSNVNGLHPVCIGSTDSRCVSIVYGSVGPAAVVQGV